MTVAEFIERCAAYQQAADVSQRWLSKRLLKDTYWLERFVAGEASMGARRFERAVEDLQRLERELTPAVRAGVAR